MGKKENGGSVNITLPIWAQQDPRLGLQGEKKKPCSYWKVIIKRKNTVWLGAYSFYMGIQGGPGLTVKINVIFSTHTGLQWECVASTLITAYTHTHARTHSSLFFFQEQLALCWGWASEMLFSEVNWLLYHKDCSWVNYSVWIKEWAKKESGKVETEKEYCFLNWSKYF